MGHIKHKSLLLIYLISGVDSGPFLEKLLHHTGVAFEGCNHQCSGPTLRGSGGGMSLQFTWGQVTYTIYLWYDI